MQANQLSDVFGVNASDLINKKIWLFDMDGTIYNEDNVYDGAIDLLKRITDVGGKYVFITNNSSKSISDYLFKLNRLGIKANKENLFTSTQATILFLKDNFPSKKIYCQGTVSMIKEFCDSGIDVTTDIDNSIEAVVVGFDTEMTSEKIKKTCFILKKGIPFIATNCDLRCPVSFGYIPDCGSICQMISNATDSKPLFIGKPSPIMVEYVLKQFGYSKSDAVVVGDRLYTDIATGINAGVTSVCVLTGEARISDIINGDIKPTFVFDSVKQILW